MFFSFIFLAVIGGGFAVSYENTELGLAGINLLAAEEHKGNKYHVYGKANWFMASKVCSANGMRLLRVNDQNKNDEVTYFMEKITAITGPYWTSATRLYDGRTWAFAVGDPVKYFNWAPGEPNNANGNEMCIETYRNGQWNDEDCSHEQFVLCESSRD